MFAARQVTRNAPRFAAQLRNPMQRRFASTAENEFIAERQHIKEHAKGTTGEKVLECAGCVGSRPNRLTKDESAVVPALAIAGANAYWLWSEHWEHWSHLPPLPERTEYPYQNIRTKNYQWGNGDKVNRCPPTYSIDGILISMADYLVKFIRGSTHGIHILQPSTVCH
uniref:Cox13 n=1 Tax=Trichoderma spinulosum TaxID=1491020 RepID=A0A223FZ53_TRISN|nr:cox13 [Trichoderma spinulosum]AST15028.1 cox13 [Trichoderma spinulosum]